MGEFGIINQASAGGIFQVRRYRVCLAAREIFLGDQRIKLSWRCFEAMELLVLARTEIVEREDFFRCLWPGITVDESSLSHCITQLRKQLGEPSEAGLIETVPRQGYRLSQAPEPIPAASVIPQPEAPTLVLATATPGGGVSSPTRAGRSARWRGRTAPRRPRRVPATQ